MANTINNFLAFESNPVGVSALAACYHIQKELGLFPGLLFVIHKQPPGLLQMAIDPIFVVSRVGRQGFKTGCK
jgi:hypothetical protein